MNSTISFRRFFGLRALALLLSIRVLAASRETRGYVQERADGERVLFLINGDFQNPGELQIYEGHFVQDLPTVVRQMTVANVRTNTDADLLRLIFFNPIQGSAVSGNRYLKLSISGESDEAEIGRERTLGNQSLRRLSLSKKALGQIKIVDADGSETRFTKRLANTGATSSGCQAFPREL